MSLLGVLYLFFYFLISNLESFSLFFLGGRKGTLLLPVTESFFFTFVCPKNRWKIEGIPSFPVHRRPSSAQTIALDAMCNVCMYVMYCDCMCMSCSLL